jgi:putative ABC transport system permease protein
VGDVLAWPDTDSDMSIYTALAQDVPPEHAAWDVIWRIDYLFAVKVARTDAATVRAVASAIRRVNPSAPVENVRFMDEVLGRAFARWRTFMWLLAVMAAVALLLACVGVYGVTSYVAAQRTHEIGVRVALGATPMHILLPLLASGVLLAIAGIVIGLVPTLWLNRLLGNRLYGVTPGDPLTLAIVSLVLTGVTVVAVWWPARRAASADPLAALRCE